MKMTKLALIVALVMGASPAYAGFVDNRASDATIEVNYKSISLEDLIADIVPREFQAEYSKPEQRKTMVRISGKGTWSKLLSEAASTSPLAIHIDQRAQRIKFSERSAVVERSPEAVAAIAAAARLAAAPVPAVVPASFRPVSAVTPVAAPVAAPAPTSAPVVVASAAMAVPRPVAVAAPPAAARPVPTMAPVAFTTTTSDYQVSAVLQRWAAQANMQYVWEPRNVEFQISAENDWGTDLRQAVRELLMSVQAGQSAQSGRERVRACIHANKPKNVLRIIRFNDRCTGDM